MAETAGASGEKDRLARLCAQLFRDGLISGQSRQRNRGRRRVVESFRHPRHGGRGHGRIFRKGAGTADRQAGIGPVARAKRYGMPARFFHDAGAFVPKGQGHFVILDQPDGPGQGEEIHRVDRGGLDPNQELVVRDFGNGDFI